MKIFGYEIKRKPKQESLPEVSTIVETELYHAKVALLEAQNEHERARYRVTMLQDRILRLSGLFSEEVGNVETKTN
jgi:hypothetical protein